MAKTFAILGGFSELDFAGKLFWWPAADHAFVEALKKHLRLDIPGEISDKDVNHLDFSGRAAHKMPELFKNS